MYYVSKQFLYDRSCGSSKEFEAELTSYVVCKHYGMDTSEAAVSYIAQWTKNGQDIEEKDKSIMRIHETASSFINTINKKISELHREREKNMEQSKGEVKDVYLVRYGALTSTEEEIVTVGALRGRAERGKSYNDVENAQELSDKEFIEGFNKENQQNFIALDHNEIKKPMVVIQWSEADLETNKAIPFGKANAMMSKRIVEIDAESKKAEEKDEYIPFEKTRYHLILPKEMDQYFNRMKVITMDRLDLGDGGYKSPYEQILNEKRHLSDEVKQALQQEINEYEQTKGQSNPEKLRAVDHTVIGKNQQDKVDHFYFKETEKDAYYTTIGYGDVEEKRLAPIRFMEEQKIEDGEVHFNPVEEIVNDRKTQTEEVFQMESAKVVGSVEKEHGAIEVKESKTIPEVGKRYVGKDTVHEEEQQQVSQKREQARRHYMMQHMRGRDY